MAYGPQLQANTPSPNRVELLFVNYQENVSPFHHANPTHADLNPHQNEQPVDSATFSSLKIL